jgi:hypothetical protein
MIIDPYRFSTSGGGGSIPPSNLRIHLESDFGVTTVGTSPALVSTWSDGTNNSNDGFQGTPNYRPSYLATDPVLNNLPSLTFSAGSDDSMVVAASSSLNFSTNGFTIYVVGYIQSWFNALSMVLQHSNGSTWTQGWGMLYINNTFRFFVNNWNNTANYVQLTAPAVNQKTLFKFTWDKTTIRASYRQNGVTTSGTKAYAGAYTNPVEAWEIFRGGAGTTIYDVSGKLGAIMAYSGVLSAQDELDLENYLKNKYGVS